MHRFYLGDGPLATATAGDELQLEGETAHRIARVLRLQPGDRIGLIGDGKEFEAELMAVGPRPRARLTAAAPPEPAGRTLTLYQALIRPNRFEWLVEKGTELGVAAFAPIVSERTAVRATEIGPARLERWRRIAVEATEQCGRHRPPEIRAPSAFADALASAEGVRVLAWEGLRRALAAPAPPAGSAADVSLFVGPEGGWSEGEIERARAAGAVFMGLGRYTLRAETAALVASARLLLDWPDADAVERRG